jgi:DNA polymerase
VIVALGKVAAQTLLGNESSIGQMRGRWHRIHGVPAMVTYHPAALLRNPALKRPTWEDMQQVRDKLRAG